MNNKTIKVFCDGASRGNPGLSGAGVFVTVVNDSNPPLEKHLSIFLGTKTNNEAEYLALLMALKFILQLKQENLKKDNTESYEMVFYMDSMLVVQQMKKKWKIKENRLKVLADQCREVIEKIGWPAEFDHVGRDLNEQADWLANQAMDLGASVLD